MQDDYSIKRFFKEVYNDQDMYQEYLNHRVFVDNDKYFKWVKTINSQNKIFADEISDFKRGNFVSQIIESSTSKGLTVSEHLYLGHLNISEQPFDTPKIESKQLGNGKYHYICNGCYKDTLEKIYDVLNKGSFTVGICCEKKTDLYRDISKYYNQLKDFLVKKGYILGSIETNSVSNNRVYLLMYDSAKNRCKIGKNK